jgi:hypothetical protein
VRTMRQYGGWARTSSALVVERNSSAEYTLTRNDRI